MNYKIIATSTFGLEALVSKELNRIGYEDLLVENGKVTFEGDEMDIAICNMWLRTADRVLIQMAQFEAKDFEELYQGTLAVKWSDLIPVNGVMHVTGKSIKSQLHSVPDCQKTVKKAVVESMRKTYHQERFEENGPVYKIEVGILKDLVTLTIDTTGPGLHKRGYRDIAGEAPLKETLAAALVMLSDWNPSKILADPFCGSGTIPIEAALIGKNIAPGLYREFVSEQWPNMPADLWQQVRTGAKQSARKDKFVIQASDISSPLVKIAKRNAMKAGVDDCIEFKVMLMEDFKSDAQRGCIISNPPYGERMGEKEEVDKLTAALGKMVRSLDNWSCFVITAMANFQDLFGAKADKNRKLYNGRILCYYYQYFSKGGFKK